MRGWQTCWPAISRSGPHCTGSAARGSAIASRRTRQTVDLRWPACWTLAANTARAAELLRQANAIRWELNRDYRAIFRWNMSRWSTISSACSIATVSRFAAARMRQLASQFIIGLPRSGTTLVEQVLAPFAGPSAAGELELAVDPSRPSPPPWADRLGRSIHRAAAYQPCSPALPSNASSGSGRSTAAAPPPVCRQNRTKVQPADFMPGAAVTPSIRITCSPICAAGCPISTVKGFSPAPGSSKISSWLCSRLGGM